MTAVLVDTQGMFDAAASLPEHVAEAAERTRGLAGLPDRSEIENVVVLGMGGSGIAGDILLATAAPFMSLPVVVVQSYTLPAFVTESTLVFAISFSGNTEETVEAVSEAAMQGAKVVAVAGPGELSTLARSWGSPLVEVPTDVTQPRAGLGSLAIPPLIVLEEIGVFQGASQWIDLAVRQLKRRRDRLTASGNDAEQLARRISGTLPLIHSAGSLGAAAGQRWKTQCNENAKIPAFWAQQPELCHNEIVGWGQHGDITRQLISLITLRHDHEHPQVMRRFELVKEIMSEVVHCVEEVRAEGEGELAQLMDLILFGDFMSLHVAALAGLDPGPVPILDELKHALAADR